MPQIASPWPWDAQGGRHPAASQASAVLHDEPKGTLVRSISILMLLNGILLLAVGGCQSGGGGANHSSASAKSFVDVSPGALGYRSARSSIAGENNLGRTDRLSVITFNMQHRDKPDQLAVMSARLTSDLDETPDFILCQEVLFNRAERQGEENTAAVLANDLGCFVRGTKRTSDREGVAIISRYPFQYYAERHLKSQTSRFLLGFRRVSVMGEFQVPTVGLVRVVNVHLTNWGFEAHVRHKQLEETLEWMVERDAELRADVVILGGDFNIKPDQDELKLVTEGSLADHFDFRNFNSDAPTRGGAGHPTYRVDYIFISSPRRAVDLTNTGDQRLWVEGLTSPQHRSRFWLSDHVPVLHEYRIAAPPVMASSTELKSIPGIAQ